MVFIDPVIANPQSPQLNRWADSPKDELKMGIAMNGAIYAAVMNDIDEIIELVRQAICSVQDIDGNHCPESPIVTFDFYGETIQLCERCFSNTKGGAYGDEIAEAAKSAQPEDTDGEL